MVEWRIKQGHILEIIGSNDDEDWRFNFMTRRVEAGGVRVNRWDRYEALVVLRAIRGSEITMIEGISRGGAIAQIIALELFRKDGRKRWLSIYGSKRTGNRAFIRELQQSAYVLALRHPGDIVPWLPPWYAAPKTGKTSEPWRWVWIAHTDYGRYLL